MQQDLCDITFVLDRSGSMGGIQDATIKAFNDFVAEQKKAPGRAAMTLVQFDDQYEVVYSGVPLESVHPLTSQTFQPRGGTALLGAIGRAVDEVGQRLASLPESQRPGKVLVAVLTDGQENETHYTEWGKSYTRGRVFESVAHQRDKYAWQFVFLGANQDAIATAASFGFDKDASLNFDASSGGVVRAMGLLSSNLSTYRSAECGKKYSFNGKTHADEQDANLQKVS